MTSSLVAEAGRSRTWAEIDLSALAHNLRLVRGLVGPKRAIIAVVKADAYRHGAPAAARAFLSAGADLLAVACVAEAVALREAGVDARVIVFGATLPDEAPRIVAYDLEPFLCDAATADALDRAAAAAGKPARVHVKVDTGMGRIGVPYENALAFIRRAAALPHVRIEGLCTHFPLADAEDKSFTQEQVERFRGVVDAAAAAGVRPALLHAANGPAILDSPDSYFNAVRPGLMLYGAYGSPYLTRLPGLRQALTLKTRIVFLKSVPAGTPLSYGHTFTTSRSSRIATIPIGYADGYDRRFSNCGQALVRGRRAPVVGRVCMDQCLLDVTDVPDARPGDEVVVYGRQGDEFISFDEAADRIGTIPHVLMCAISPRAPRVYV